MNHWHTPVDKPVQEWCDEVGCQVFSSPHIPKHPSPSRCFTKFPVEVLFCILDFNLNPLTLDSFISIFYRTHTGRKGSGVGNYIRWWISKRDITFNLGLTILCNNQGFLTVSSSFYLVPTALRISFSKNPLIF